MKKILRILGALLLLALIAGGVMWYVYLRPEPPAISDADREKVRLLPLPAEMRLQQGLLPIDTRFGHSFSKEPTIRLEKAIERFYDKLALQTGEPFEEHSKVWLDIRYEKQIGDIPLPGVDESYSLEIDSEGISLQASTELGILYGLESLSQLIEKKGDSLYFPQLWLKDKPRYSWRGLMIDASRHWMPTGVILRNLEAMAHLKMNVFHWHLSDYQGFRVESKRFPLLHELGSNGQYYKQEEIREVIQFAADRGIRVIPEFDMPGHATSWLVGYPDLASAPGPYVLDSVVLGTFVPVMDPTNEKVYEFLDTFLQEIAGLFPDPYVHIGGDEVTTRDWSENEDIQNFMRTNGIDDTQGLQAFFNKRIQGILAKHGKKMQGWDEILHPDLASKGILVQTWRNQRSLWETARSGNQAILSAGYYLDHKRPAGYHYQVDPEQIPGAVNVEIDSLNWKSWDCTIYFNDTEIEGQIYLFGAPENYRGIVQFMGAPAGFDQVQPSANNLSFSMDTQFGVVNYSLEMAGDSLLGNASLSLLDLDLKGVRNGGSDMPGGIPLPKFERIEPLTEEQKANILGGEACMWTELVDSTTIDSRIWPRAAAIAEKLWSPSKLTADEKDMYRRLLLLNDGLEQFGLVHQKNAALVLRQTIPEPFVEDLVLLISFLQEDVLFNRLTLYEPALYASTPMNRMVDAAPAESYPSFVFNRDVDAWIDSKDLEALDRITQLLRQWKDLNNRLQPLFISNEGAAEIQPHSKHLAELAQVALETVESDLQAAPASQETEELIAAAHKAYGGTILPAASGLEKLIRSKVVSN